jgi:hypothetical protein
MEYTHKVLKETLIKELEEARSHSIKNDDGGWLSFTGLKLKPVLHNDEYFLAESSDGYGSIYFTPDDFEPEDIISILSINSKLVTKEIVQKVVEMYFDTLAKAKD